MDGDSSMNGAASSKARLLIVDDEAVFILALRDTLQTSGYDVIGCTSATEAVNLLQCSAFDLLLADLVMPEMSGIELLRTALREDPSLVGIIMTGDGTIATAVAAMQSGAFDYILKPFDFNAILPVLARGLAVRQLRLENAALERQLCERAAELEIANRELEAFAHSVSHDLRTPLNGIFGFAELLRLQFADQLPDEAKAMLGYIHGSATRMNQLIDDLLRLSKLGHRALLIETVVIEAEVRTLFEELGQQHPLRKIALNFYLSKPTMQADQPLIRQVFANLLSNSHKFTRDRLDAEIEVGSEMQGEDLVYYVRDNGVGFDMARSEKLFGVFQRLHRSDDFEGNGIGLSIVQRIIQQHGGRIWALSNPNHGAAFYFTISSGNAALSKTLL